MERSTHFALIYNLLPSTTGTLPLKMTEPIKLHVGERTFRTDKSTLLEIPYFKGFFSDAIGSAPGPDGAYFVDLNPDIFEHSKRSQSPRYASQL